MNSSCEWCKNWGGWLSQADSANDGSGKKTSVRFEMKQFDIFKHQYENVIAINQLDQSKGTQPE